MKITIYLFFIGILFLSGCGDAVDFIYNKDIPCARIVVYAFIEGDSLVRAEVNSSQIYGRSSGINSSHPFRVSASVNGEYAEELTHEKDNLYTSTITRPRQGDKVSISVSCPEFPSVYAETCVEKTFASISVDTATCFNPTTMDQDLKLSIRLDDDGMQTNYYQLIVENQLHYSSQVLDSQTQACEECQDTCIYSYDFFCGSEPLLQEIVTNLLGEEKNNNPYHLFTNHQFSGKTRSLEISLPYPRSGETRSTVNTSEGLHISIISKHYTLRIKILKLDAALFSYFRTLGLYGQPAFYGEPQQVYSNVEAGLGVVGSFSAREVVIDFPISFSGSK